MLLALDLNSRSCGVAFGGPTDGGPRCVTWRLPGCGDEDKLNRSCAGLYNSISEFSKLIHPDIIAIEATFNPQKAEGDSRSNNFTVVSSFSLAAVARAAAQNVGAKVVLTHVQSWRKTFCGHGRPKDPKEATLARCKLLNWSVANDDEGDAAGLWCHEMSLHYRHWSPKGTPLFRSGAAA